MSKKNKALKQLLKAQMQANASAIQQGKDLSKQPQTISSTATPAANLPNQQVVADKQTGEFTLIKKDIKLSVILILAVVFCLLVIFFVDKAHPFLLSLANQIFKLISK